MYALCFLNPVLAVLARVSVRIFLKLHCVLVLENENVLDHLNKMTQKAKRCVSIEIFK